MKKFFKFIGFFILGLIALGIVIGAMSGGNNSNPGVSVSDAPATQNAVSESNNTTSESNNGMTAQQKNAVRSAKQYLSFKGFSRDGLIQQLSSDAGDGYDVNDATVAVDSLNIDWNEQAIKSAQTYLQIQGFSCKGLVEQLSSPAGDGFTKEQAEYGAKGAGACN